MQTMAACALLQLTATWMSGNTVEFHIDSNSTIGELRRRIMLASGGLQKIALMVERTALEGNGHQPLSHFKAQGLDNGAELTIVVSQVWDASAAQMLTNAELTDFFRHSAGPSLRHIDLHGCERVSDGGLRALSAGCPGLRKIN